MTRRLALHLVLAVAALAAVPATSPAATFTVTSTADSGAGTLRDAINQADVTSEKDDIVLAGATYALGSPLVVDEPVAIRGVGSGATVVSGAGATRVFEVELGAHLELTDLAVVDGAGGGTDGTAVRLEFGLGADATHVTLTRTRIAGHRGGSAVYVQGESTATVVDTLFENNGGLPATTNNAGALWVRNDARATVTRSTFRDNHVMNEGGAINIWNNSVVDIAGSSFSGNSAGDDGGAINIWNDSVVTVNDTSIRDNDAVGDGGGVNVWNNARLTVGTTTIAGNGADANGGAINLWNDTVLSMTRSTVSGNDAGGEGGAFFAWNNAESTLTNTTVHGNTAGSTGGAFHHENSAAVAVVNSTVSGNNAAQGGVLFNDTNPSPGNVFFRFENSLLQGNTATSGPSGCAHDPFADPSMVASSGFNVEDAATCSLNATGDKPSTNAQLGPLQDNGGPTQTRAIAAGSPARNMIPPGSRRRSFAACPTVDQRGVARPQEGACDAGAFEYQPPPPPAAAAPPAAAPPAAVVVLPPRPIAARLPALKASQVFSLPSARRCVSRRRFRIRLRTPRGVSITRVVVKVNRKTVRTVRGRRITAPVNLRGLPRGRFTVSIQITTADGRRVSGQRRYRTCAQKRRSRSSRPKV